MHHDACVTRSASIWAHDDVRLRDRNRVSADVKLRGPTRTDYGHRLRGVHLASVVEDRADAWNPGRLIGIGQARNARSQLVAGYRVGMAAIEDPAAEGDNPVAFTGPRPCRVAAGLPLELEQWTSAPSEIAGRQEGCVARVERDVGVLVEADVPGRKVFSRNVRVNRCAVDEDGR